MKNNLSTTSSRKPPQKNTLSKLRNPNVKVKPTKPKAKQISLLRLSNRYIIHNLFSYAFTKPLHYLKWIRYSKQFQSRLGININNYIIYNFLLKKNYDITRWSFNQLFELAKMALTNVSETTWTDWLVNYYPWKIITITDLNSSCINTLVPRWETWCDNKALPKIHFDFHKINNFINRGEQLNQCQALFLSYVNVFCYSALSWGVEGKEFDKFVNYYSLIHTAKRMKTISITMKGLISKDCDWKAVSNSILMNPMNIVKLTITGYYTSERQSLNAFNAWVPSICQCKNLKHWRINTVDTDNFTSIFNNLDLDTINIKGYPCEGWINAVINCEKQALNIKKITMTNYDIPIEYYTKISALARKLPLLSTWKISNYHGNVNMDDLLCFNNFNLIREFHFDNQSRTFPSLYEFVRCVPLHSLTVLRLNNMSVRGLFAGDHMNSLWTRMTQLSHLEMKNTSNIYDFFNAIITKVLDDADIKCGFYSLNIKNSWFDASPGTYFMFLWQASPKLIALNIANCRINVLNIIIGLRGLKWKVLNIKNNYFPIQAWRSLCDVLETYEDLECWKIGTNKEIKTEEIKWLIWSIFKLKKLEKLDFSYLLFDDQSCTYWAKWIERNPKLASLNLRECNIGNDLIMRLLENDQFIVCCQKLNLIGNGNISEMSFRKWIAKGRNFVVLRNIYLAKIEIDKEVKKELKSVFGECLRC